MTKVVIGIDVGSTTVKMTVVDPTTKEILWSKYQRHETRQPEMTRDMLREIHAAFPMLKNDQIRTFITGSGGSPIAPQIGAKFVQEVNAVTMAVEKLHPDVGSVIELGGQDAKIIMFKQNNETGDKTAQTSMNDKCASGTGATRCPSSSSIRPSSTTSPPSAACSPRPTSSTSSSRASRATRS